ncbi:MAG: HesA/MoeB/ThiF family protein [Oscillospiraceae bacterium]|nr:HesA/MoeB/ThiF family protein [Oscillospiraceae bacterium]
MSYFVKNLAILTEEEQKLLSEKRVLVAGCGGLGGSVIELLCRSGFMHLTVVDGDVFEPSNMNRQILCTTETLGQSKALTAAKRARLISPEIEIEAVADFITEENIRGLIRGKDLVMDALDSVEGRLMLEDACAAEGVCLVHGAVKEWMIQTAVCPPGAGVLHKLYKGKTGSGGTPGGVGVNVFSCASFEVTEAIKLMTGREGTLSGKILFFDLYEKESQIVEL